MNWKDGEIGRDDAGLPMFLGLVNLSNDKGDHLASVLWFYEGGPFYASACDLREPDVVRRIGPCGTLDSAKAACISAIEGTTDIRNRAGYPRDRAK